jgi:putative transposase
MVRPAVRRQAVEHVQEAFGLSERSACRALGFPRASHRYESTRVDAPELVAKLRKLAVERPRFGYRRLHRMLRRAGVMVNHKRIYRLYRIEGLTVRIKRRKRLAASPRVAPPPPVRVCQRWSMDFVCDHTAEGIRFRVLTLVDDFSRRSPGLLVERSIGGGRVVRFLEELARLNGYPETIVIDNGPEFVSNALDQWAHAHDVRLHFIRPGRPVENAFIESFNGKFRDECLNANWFHGLEHAREIVSEWLEDYNERRPHSSLGGLTPMEFERAQERTSALG